MYISEIYSGLVNTVENAYLYLHYYWTYYKTTKQINTQQQLRDDDLID
jgi:hypothetical protein